MSKQSEAKKRQGYVAKPLSNRCRVCKNLKVTEIEKSGWGGTWIKEKLRCGIGGFKVTPNAVCNEFIKAEPEF